MPLYYDLTVRLAEVAPPVWRRFLIEEGASFAELHRAIQDACGWQDRHLYEFTDADRRPLAGLPDLEDWRDLPVPAAAATPLASVFDTHDRCNYLYDLGDHWDHLVICEGVVDHDERFHRRLLDGGRAFPPEDAGGIAGYEQCAAVARGEDPGELWVELDHLRSWMGDWHPDRFDLAATRAAFDRADAPPVPAEAHGRGFPVPPAAVLPLVAVPDRDELAAAAAVSPLVSRVVTFAQWVGAGRKLTATGNLTLADGRELVTVLGTDDRVDERIGDRVFKTTSTVELAGVDTAFRLARACGFVKVRKGTVSATKRGSTAGADALADWHAVLAGLVKLGVLANRYAHATWIDPYWKGLVDDQLPGMLAHLLLAGRSVPVEELAARLWGLVAVSFVLDELDEQQLERHRDVLTRDVRRIGEVLAELGAVVVEGVETVTSMHGVEREAGGRVRLTPLGVVGVRRLLGAEAAPAPR